MSIKKGGIGVSEKPGIEKALKESEEKYLTLFHQSPVGILITDTEGKILEFNEAACRLLGYSREEFAGLCISDINVDDPEKIKACLSRLLKEGKAEFEAEYKAKDGGTRNIDVVSQAIVLSGCTVFHWIWRDITEHKKADEALKELNARIETLIQAIPDAVYFKDIAGKYQIVNKALEEFTGLSQRELIGGTDETLLPPDLIEACKKSDEETMKGQGPLHFEERYADAGGRDRFYDTVKAPIFNGLNKIIGLVGISRNITEQKYIEEELRLAIERITDEDNALRVSETRLNEAQHIAHIGNWEWDIATNCVQWSDELYRIYGYEPHEIAPDYRLIVETMHPKSRDEFLGAIDAALKGERPFEMDYIFFRKDGSEAILHTIGQVAYDNNGAPAQILGTVQDITGQKRAEKTLRESEEKFRNIFDNANDGILIADSSTMRFVDANKTVCGMLGYTREEITKLGVKDIHPDKDFPRVLKEFEKQMRGEKIIAEDLPVMRKDGSIFYADIGATIITLGGKRRAVGIFRDITGRRQAEEQIRSALREKEILLKELHHRVKNNLQIVASMLRLQSGYITDREARMLFEESWNRIETMAIIHDKLYRTKDLARVDFKEYVEELSSNLLTLTAGKSEEIELESDVEGVVLDVNNSIPCGLIINELVSNSLKHAFPDGRKGKITISMHSDDDGGITLFVGDNGIGFSDGVDFRNTESLGLQLVVSLVEQLDGVIELDRSEGTTFTIKFQA